MANKKAGFNRVIGLHWESRFYWVCKRSGIVLFRIPLGAKQISAKRLIRVQTPFDWILCKEGKTALLDTKHTSSKNFTKSQITPHQFLALNQAYRQGIIAGYLIDFALSDKIIFFHAGLLEECLNGRSLKPEDGLALGDFDQFDVNLLFGL